MDGGENHHAGYVHCDHQLVGVFQADIGGRLVFNGILVALKMVEYSIMNCLLKSIQMIKVVVHLYIAASLNQLKPNEVVATTCS